MCYEENKSGINSLSGFAYQIKVFAIKVFDLKENMQVEFETIDDVSLKKTSFNQLDHHDMGLILKSIRSDRSIAIQVKCTTISSSMAKKIILNWILLRSYAVNVEQYELITNDSYNNSETLFDFDAEELYDDVLKSNKKKNAIITKVKDYYINDKNKFIEICQEIRDNFVFKSIEDIDSELEDRTKDIFFKAVNTTVFNLRLNEFMQRITVNIMNAVSEKKPYVLTYFDYIRMLDSILTQITIDSPVPSYSDFKKINKVDLEDSEIANQREYKQLKTCKLPDRVLVEHLICEMYYKNVSIMYLECNKTNLVEDIELTSHNNFEDVKLELSINNNDTPLNRLIETKKHQNAYAENTQIKDGALIYLTRENAGELQISWEDEK